MNKALDTIEHKAAFGKRPLPAHIVVSGVKQPEKVEGWFGLLSRAIIDHQRVELEYSTAYKKDEKSCRTVDPCYLYLWDNLWYLRAFCHTRKAPLSFALDKIQELTATGEYFMPDPAVDPEKELQDGFGAVLDGPETEVVVRIDPRHQPYVKRIRWHHSQTETMLPDGRLELRFKVKGTAAIKLWLYRGLPHVEVVGPQALREEMHRELEASAAKFADK
jgi:predicted DNA-binding transcriptional regulator YafY